MLSFVHGTEINQLNKRNSLKKGSLWLRDPETFSESYRTAAPPTPQGSCPPPTCPELLVNWFSKPLSFFSQRAAMVVTKAMSHQSSQHIIRSHPWGQDHGAHSCPQHSGDHSPFSHSPSGCGILNGLQYRRTTVVKRTGSFPVSCYWINMLIFVLNFTYTSQSSRQKLFQMCLKDLWIKMF